MRVKFKLLGKTSLLTLVLLVPGTALADALTAPRAMFPDRNRIDALTASPVITDQPTLLGDSRDPSIFYQRIISRAFSGGTNNFVGMIAKPIPTEARVVIGALASKFTNVNGIWKEDVPSGQTLAEDASSFTLTKANGDSYRFSKISEISYFNNTAYALLSTINMVGGRSWNFAYSDATFPQGGNYTRLKSVVTNEGYQFHFDYVSDALSGYSDLTNWWRISRVSGLNMAVDYCDPAALHCGTLSSEALVTEYAYIPNGAFEDWITTYPDGKTFTFHRYGNNGDALLKGVGYPGTGTTFHYDDEGRVSSVVDDSGTWIYGWFDNGIELTGYRYAPMGGTATTYGNPGKSLLFSYSNELSRQTNYEYDSVGRLIRIIYPEGNKAQFTYDARGNITEKRVISKTPGTPPDIIEAASYPSTCSNLLICNKPTSTIPARYVGDPVVKQVDYAYDGATGLITSITAPAASSGASRAQTRYSHTPFYAYFKNSSGSIVQASSPVRKLTTVSSCIAGASCTGTANEVKTAYSYGPQTPGVANTLLPLSSSAGSGDGLLTATTTFTYDYAGNTTYVDGPLPNGTDVTRMFFDKGRRVVGVIGPDPDQGGVLKNSAIKTTFNSDGQLASVERGTTNGQTDNDWTAFQSSEQVITDYNGFGEKSRNLLVSGGVTYSVTQFSYDANGQLECSAKRMNPATFSNLPSSACSLAAAGSVGPDRISKTTYDVAGEVVKQQSAYGITTANGFPETLQRDDVTSTYTANGNIQTVADAKNNLTTYEYDGFDRLTKTRYPSPDTAGSSSTSDFEQLSYDGASNVISRRTRDNQTISLGYDNLNRLTSKNLPGAEPDVTYVYDLIGRLTSASQTGNALSFTYDALSRNLTQVGPLGTITSTWDIAGRRTRLDLPGTFYTTYDYYATGAMWAIRESGAASGPGVNYIGYDDLGRRANIQRGNGTVTYYNYDPVSRLSQLGQAFPSSSSNQVLGYGYNPASQIISRSASNDAYAMRQQYNASRAYTTNGLNQYLTAGSVSPAYDGRGNLTAQGSMSYAYSSENLLSQVTQPSGATALSYDPAMRLYQVGGTRFLYDGTDLVAEYNGSGNVLRRYVHGPGTDEVITWYEGGDAFNRRWLHTDERGSVIAVSDGSGALIQANAYDEWGNPQSGNLGRFGYTGQTWLPEVGLWYYKARMYSPRFGRFMQTDPIGYSDGMNLYAYVGNDPINAVDPTGLGTCLNAGCSWFTNSDGPTFASGGTGFGATWADLDDRDRRLDQLREREAANSAVLPQSTQEERWRGDCNKAANDNSTPIASAIATGAEIFANLADATATIAVFVPGGQGVAGGAKLASYAAQGVQGLANLSIGRSTGNYSALRAQGAGFLTGSVFGAGSGRVANAALKGTGTFTRSEAGALGDALGAIYGDAASGVACGQH